MTKNNEQLSLSEEDLLARGFIYKFISFAYRYPEESIINCLREMWTPAGKTIADFPRLFPIFKLMDKEFNKDVPDNLENEFVILFGHTAQGNCPPFEIEYGESNEDIQKPHELSDIAAFYRAAGLKPSENGHERVDFISVELEFANYLYFKQAFAAEKNDAKLIEACVDLQRKFMKDHLARWTPAFTQMVMKHSKDGFYGLLAKLTHDLISMCCNEIGVKPGSEKLVIRIPIDLNKECEGCSMPQNEPI